MGYHSIDSNETIFALCSGALPSAVAIIRVSGKSALTLAAKHFRPRNRTTESSTTIQRGMELGDFVDDNGKIIDEVLLLIFPAPNSLTGEDVVEIQCHGSVGVVKALTTLLEKLGCRPAERGEFSFRALKNGKMSAERLDELGDLFLAKEPAQLESIYRRRERALDREIGKLREHLLRLQAVLDTAVDFSEEYSNVVSAVTPLTTEISESVQLITHRYSAFRSGSEAPRLVLAGSPNAGKSSLFNALVGNYRTIVHERPGTTRDVVEEDLVIDGSAWKLVDTAGFRHLSASAEAQGIEIGRNYLGASALWILVVDGAVGLKPTDQSLLSEFAHIPHLVVWNKRDLPEWREPPVGVDAIACSTLTLDGSNELMAVLVKKVEESAYRASGVLPSGREYAALSLVETGLSELLELARTDCPPEVMGEKVRGIIHSLDSVIGEIGPEDVLERIFGEFCIGK